MRRVHFYRTYRRFQGGHLKVWDYFNHVRSSPRFTPTVEFSADSVWDETNPWRAAEDRVVDPLRRPAKAPDILFVAGMDWSTMDRGPWAGTGRPVVNLIQHIRHADPADERYPFLARRAIRICLSDVVADAIRGSGVTRGPVFAVPIGIDVGLLSAPLPPDRSIDVLVGALNHPGLGAELARLLERPNRRVDLLTKPLPRSEFLHRMGAARVSVLLPADREGFYLPALEGMALETLVVCPRFAGEPRAYRNGENCLRPAYALEDLARSAETALSLAPGAAGRMRERASETAEHHSLVRERRAFLEILEQVDRYR